MPLRWLPLGLNSSLRLTRQKLFRISIKHSPLIRSCYAVGFHEKLVSFSSLIYSYVYRYRYLKLIPLSMTLRAAGPFIIDLRPVAFGTRDPLKGCQSAQHGVAPRLDPSFFSWWLPWWVNFFQFKVNINTHPSFESILDDTSITMSISILSWVSLRIGDVRS